MQSQQMTISPDPPRLRLDVQQCGGNPPLPLKGVHPVVRLIALPEPLSVKHQCDEFVHANTPIIGWVIR